ncbi:hypothetical protein FRC12_019359 [Ceratobasidium sp. 428]|nr:hypothetical protein FRC12_019359 [Ceratobasidium sp. 428]
MAEKTYDLLIIGATGYTHRLAVSTVPPLDRGASSTPTLSRGCLGHPDSSRNHSGRPPSLPAIDRFVLKGPPTGRFSSLRTPSHGTVVSVRRILSAIAADETAVVLLGAITFVPSSGFHRSTAAASGSSPSTALGNVGRTKLERYQGQGKLGLITG